MKVANEKEAFWIKPSVRLLFTTLEYRFTPTCNEKQQPEQTPSCINSPSIPRVLLD